MFDGGAQPSTWPRDGKKLCGFARIQEIGTSFEKKLILIVPLGWLFNYAEIRNTPPSYVGKTKRKFRKSASNEKTLTRATGRLYSRECS